jgi:hypothetical protein
MSSKSHRRNIVASGLTTSGGSSSSSAPPPDSTLFAFLDPGGILDYDPDSIQSLEESRLRFSSGNGSSGSLLLWSLAERPPPPSQPAFLTPLPHAPGSTSDSDNSSPKRARTRSAAQTPMVLIPSSSTHRVIPNWSWGICACALCRLGRGCLTDIFAPLGKGLCAACFDDCSCTCFLKMAPWKPGDVADSCLPASPSLPLGPVSFRSALGPSGAPGDFYSFNLRLGHLPRKCPPGPPPLERNLALL